MRRQVLRGAAGIGGVILAATAAMADEFHYNNILIGDRAAGMGGAYTAVSDDPSGMYYNPAGLAYVAGRSLSASVNAYSVSTRTYKGALAGQDWTRTSSALLPNFFGIVQPVGKVKVGFSYAVPDSNQEDQDQTFGGLQWSPTDPRPSTHVINFNNKNDTTLFGPSAAMLLSDTLSVGATLYVHKRGTEAILNQSRESDDAVFHLWRNDYIETDEWGLRPVLGVLWSPVEKMSVGISAAKTFVLTSENLSQTTFTTNDPTSSFDRTNPTMVTSDDRREYPWQVTAGVAFFPSPSLLVSADLSYSSSYTYGFLGRTNEREAVLNGAVGVEYYLTPAWAVRAGFYTDFANTPKLDPARSNQYEHIDLYGGTLSLSHFTKNTSLTIGGSVKSGSGDAQILGGASPIQEATLTSWSLFVSYSYSY